MFSAIALQRVSPSCSARASTVEPSGPRWLKNFSFAIFREWSRATLATDSSQTSGVSPRDIRSRLRISKVERSRLKFPSRTTIGLEDAIFGSETLFARPPAPISATRIGCGFFCANAEPQMEMVSIINRKKCFFTKQPHFGGRTIFRFLALRSRSMSELPFRIRCPLISKRSFCRCCLYINIETPFK